MFTMKRNFYIRITLKFNVVKNIIKIKSFEITIIYWHGVIYLYFCYHGSLFDSVAQVLCNFASVLRFVGDVSELVLPFENNKDFGFSSFDFEDESLLSRTLLDSIPSDNLP